MKTGVPPPEQYELLPPDHVSMHPDRLRNFDRVNPEAFYARAWIKVNPRRTLGYLNHILCPKALRDQGQTATRYSRRDAVVAASVVQWLGTNVGRAFVLECERQIEAAQARQQKLSAERRRARGVVDTRSPLVRRKATLAAARKRITDNIKKESK
jgi:hypothetical protein